MTTSSPAARHAHKPPALIARCVSKWFDVPTRFQVLREVSFEVGAGEFVALMGKSGSGKSTLLYVLSTMDTEYEGEVIIGGKRVTGLSIDQLAEVRNAHIGFVFQFHYLLPEFTCLENVMIPALKLGRLSRDEIEHEALEKLRLLGLADQALKPSNKLSGGQQQRVAIARALINRPTIIMGDEPTGNLDTANSENVFRILRELSHEYGQAIVAVTHDPDFAAGADRIITLHDGAILSQ